MVELRKLVAEGFGTAGLVFFAVGVATLTFGFGLAGESVAAGVVATSLAFGLVLLALAYGIGPISGCHINPAVTLGALVSGRIKLKNAVAYWVAQFVGGIVGAVVLWVIFDQSVGAYDMDLQGLGTNGWGSEASMVGLGWGGAFAIEVILTGLFVLVILGATSKLAPAGFDGIPIGLALTTVHLIGIPLTGTSVNPARSLGPALIVGGDALEQVWLFIVAPLVGAALAAVLHRYLYADKGRTTAAAAT